DVGRQRSPPGWAGRGDGPGGTQGQHLPLHGLPQRRHGDRGRRQGDGSRAKVRALSMRDFVYHRASSLDEARRLGAEEGAAFLAGGQTLLRDLKHHRRTPTSLVKISGVLPREIDLRDGGITIGAGATHAAVAISKVVRKRLPRWRVWQNTSATRRCGTGPRWAVPSSPTRSRATIPRPASRSARRCTRRGGTSPPPSSSPAPAGRRSNRGRSSPP